MWAAGRGAEPAPVPPRARAGGGARVVDIRRPRGPAMRGASRVGCRRGARSRQSPFTLVGRCGGRMDARRSARWPERAEPWAGIVAGRRGSSVGRLGAADGAGRSRVPWAFASILRKRVARVLPAAGRIPPRPPGRHTAQSPISAIAGRRPRGQRQPRRAGPPVAVVGVLRCPRAGRRDGSGERAWCAASRGPRARARVSRLAVLGPRLAARGSRLGLAARGRQLGPPADVNDRSRMADADRPP